MWIKVSWGAGVHKNVSACVYMYVCGECAWKTQLCEILYNTGSSSLKISQIWRYLPPLQKKLPF